MTELLIISPDFKRELKSGMQTLWQSLRAIYLIDMNCQFSSLFLSLFCMLLKFRHCEYLPISWGCLKNHFINLTVTSDALAGIPGTDLFFHDQVNDLCSRCLWITIVEFLICLFSPFSGFIFLLPKEASLPASSGGPLFLTDHKIFPALTQFRPIELSRAQGNLLQVFCSHSHQLSGNNDSYHSG